MKYIRLFISILSIFILLFGCSSSSNNEVELEYVNTIDTLKKTISEKEIEIKDKSINNITLKEKNKELSNVINKLNNDIKKLENVINNDKEYINELNNVMKLQFLEFIDMEKRWFISEEDMKVMPFNESLTNNMYFTGVIDIIYKVRNSNDEIWYLVKTPLEPIVSGWVKEEKLQILPNKNKYGFYDSDHSLGDIHLGDTKVEVIGILGEPIKIDMGSSITGVTYDYIYNDITVSFEVYNDTVADIYTKSSKYITNIGLKVGSNALEVYNTVTKTYGEFCLSEANDEPSVNEFFMGDNNYIYIEWGKKREIRPDSNDVITKIRLFCGPVEP